MSVFLLWVACAGTPDAAALDQRRAETTRSSATQSSPGERVRTEASQAKPERAKTVQAKPRQLFEIHKELRRLLREEAVGKDRKAWESTVLSLVELYGEITRDERLPSSDTLNGYRVKLRSRLLKVQKQLEREFGNRRETGRAAGTSLAAGLGSAGQGSAGTEKSLPGGASGGAAFDSGLALVDLIQRTISPEFWDVNGGPGTIVYYRQWHALVVRATPQIHRRIGGAVRGVRK